MPQSTLQPIEKKDWDEQKARHLLNRAGFGFPYERVIALTQAGPEAAVASLVDFDGLPREFSTPDFLFEPLPPEEINFIIKGMPEADVQEAANAMNELQRETIELLKRWWLAQMRFSRYPLQEKLALCWHGHFATSASKVESAWANYQLNQVFRAHGAGDLKQLVLEVGQSPAMLQYLDNNDNVKDGPNENWARELFELFTLGIGNYTEADVKDAARGFTGWSANHKRFLYRDYNHDPGPKTIFGRTGYFDGWDVVDIVFEQPACAPHFARTLWTFFAYENPEPELISALADHLREHRFQVKPMLTAMFLSREFYSARAMGTQVKSPVQLAIQLAHDLSLDPPPLGEMADFVALLGQNLFYPPNVKGWDGGPAWINTGAMLARYNLPEALATVQPPASPADATMMNSAMYGNGMMAQGVDATGSLARLLTPLPEDKRAYVAERLGLNRPHYRRSVMEYRAAAQKRPSWDPQRIFNKLQFDSASSCVDRLASVFLNTRISNEQRLVLLESLGASESPDAPLTPADLSTDRMNATLHLLFSMAEYQMC